MMLAMSGCQATVRTGSPEAAPLKLTSEAATFEATPGEKPAGRLYVVVGDESGNDGQLYDLRLSPPTLELLAPTKRVSNVGACADHVVVAAGQQEVGFTDHLQELRIGALVPIDGLGPLQAFSPRLAGDCRVAYTWVDRGTTPLVGELRIWDPSPKSGRTLYRARPGDGPLATTDWGPNGEAAAIRLRPVPNGDVAPGTPPGRSPAVVVVRPDGSVSEIALSGDPGLFTWGKRWMAVMDEEQQATVFIDPATSERRTLRDWRPVVWSPDGE
ncbi:MAG: hypothetical protein ACRDV9_12025, partial [Acidimicrobiia bacterium]